MQGVRLQGRGGSQCSGGGPCRWCSQPNIGDISGVYRQALYLGRGNSPVVIKGSTWRLRGPEGPTTIT